MFGTKAKKRKVRRSQLTKKEIILILCVILGIIALTALLVWIICNIAPILIGAIVFIPWLFAALSDGANI